MFSLEQYNALRRGAGIVDRSNRGRILLKGRDRLSYLQGLLTNDIAALEAGTGCYAAFLTPQGRMITDLRVVETGHEAIVDLPGAVADGVRVRLAQFVFSEDVEVLDMTTSHVQVGVYGPAAARVLGSLAGAEPPLRPEELERMALFANMTPTLIGATALVVRSDDIGTFGFDVFVASGERDRLRDALRAGGAADVDAEAAEVCRVEAGRPVFGVDMDTDTIPLEAGIEDRAISLTKGCYVGQEIIIRVLHRGHGRVARKLVGMTLDATAAVPAHGVAIRAADREIGSITSAVMSPALGRPVALGYVHRDFIEPGTQVSVGDVAAIVTRLPFVPS
jgi:folate-binding protein YgfZ